MLVHSVFFWLDRNLGKEKQDQFRQGLESLKGIEAVQSLWLGSPASTTRPAVDRTYDFALTVLLKDMTGHDQYQKDPLHQAFLETFSSFWIKVVIYDHQTEAAS